MRISIDDLPPATQVWTGWTLAECKAVVVDVTDIGGSLGLGRGRVFGLADLEWRHCGGLQEGVKVVRARYVMMNDVVLSR